MTIELKKTIAAIIRPGEQSGYVGECLDMAVVTQGETLDEVVSNLQEAVSLHLEDENPQELGFINQPSLIVTFEVQPEYA